MNARWIKANVAGGVKFTHSGTNIVNSFEIKMKDSGLLLSINCNLQYRAEVAKELKEDDTLKAKVSNTISSDNANRWSLFDLAHSTSFMRLGASNEELNAFINIINQKLEPEMENKDEIRSIVSSTQFVIPHNPLEGKSWNHFGPTNI